MYLDAVITAGELSYIPAKTIGSYLNKKKITAFVLPMQDKF